MRQSFDHLPAGVYDDFLDSLRAADWPSPEHDLLAAALQAGIICYTGVIGANPSQRRAYATEAKQWILCREPSAWPFAFENIMATLLPNVGLETFRRRVLAQHRPGIAPGYTGYRGGHRRSLDVKRSLRSRHLRPLVRGQ